LANEDLDWIYIADAANLIAFDRTIEDAREELLEAAFGDLLKLRAFRTKSKISKYPASETLAISKILCDGDVFDPIQMPPIENESSSVDESYVLGKEDVKPFRCFYEDVSWWTLIEYDFQSYCLESRVNWSESIFEKREFSIIEPGHFTDLKENFFLKTEIMYLKVEVNKPDLIKLFDVKKIPTDTALISAPLPETTRRMGRKPANWWPDFAEELAAYIHDDGLPKGVDTEGQDEVIKAIFGRMAETGKAEPSRTQVQPVVNAVLRRLRAAGK